MKKIMVIVLMLLLAVNVNAKEINSQLLIINKTTNQMAYFDNGELVRIFDVATGRDPSYTPEGVFSIVTKIENRPYYTLGIPGGDPNNPLGPRWFGLDARETYGTTYGIHGNSDPDSIGTYASAGCIRMNNDEVIWLFDRVKLFATVIIVSSNEEFVQLAMDYDYPLVEKVNENEAPELPSEWAIYTIDNLTKNGLAESSLLSNYRSNITRAEVTSLIIDLYERINGNVSYSDNFTPFIDIGDSEYKEAILKAKSVGLINGVSEDKFNPNGQITREEVAVMIHRFIKEVGYEPRNISVYNFDDSHQVSNWAKASVNFVKQYEIMSGISQNSFGPSQKMTREQALTIFYRIALMKQLIE